MPNLGETATRVLALGRGRCPECKPAGRNAIRRAPKLEPAGNSSMACPECGETYPIGGGVP